MKRFILLFGILVFVVAVLNSCGGSSGSSSKAASASTYTFSGMVIDLETGASLPGLTVTLRRASDNATITSTTADSTGKITVIAPAGANVYLHFSGTSGGTAYVPTNSPIVTMTENVTENDSFPVMTAAYFGDASGSAWLYLNALDQSNHPLSGVSIAFSSALAGFGYWDGSAYDDGLMATSNAALTTASPTNAFGYATTSGTVTATWTKSGMNTYTAEYPLVVGEVTYDWNVFTAAATTGGGTTNGGTNNGGTTNGATGACLETGCGIYGCVSSCELISQTSCNAMNNQGTAGFTATFYAGQTCP
jgi:hypothetical protein